MTKDYSHAMDFCSTFPEYFNKRFKQHMKKINFPCYEPAKLLCMCKFTREGVHDLRMDGGLPTCFEKAMCVCVCVCVCEINELMIANEACCS